MKRRHSGSNLTMEKEIGIDEKQHAFDVLQKIESLRKDKQHCDFLIKVGSEEIPAHRIVLSASSDYFKAMLSHDTKENQSGVVEMKGVEPRSIKKCVEFIYTGKAAVSDDKREELMYVAHMLQLTKLYNGIALFLEKGLSCQSFFVTKKLANMYNCQHLVKVCNEFAMMHFREIAQSDDFKESDQEFISLLMGSKKVKASEAVKCKVLMKWVNHDSSARQGYLLDLMKKLDWLKIPLNYRGFLTNNEPLVYQSAECLKLLTMSVFQNVKFRDVEIQGKENSIVVFDKTSKMLQRYDMQDDSWEPMQQLKNDMMNQGFTAVVLEEYLYVFGNNTNVYRIVHTDTDAAWEKMANKNLESGCAVVLNGLIYTCDYSNCRTQIEQFDPAANKWTLLCHKTRNVLRPALAAAEGKIFCIGGSGDYGTTQVVEKYDPIQSTWTNDNPLQKARQCAAAVVMDEQIYVLGGTSGSNILADVEFRCPKTKAWTTVTQMKVARYKLSACCIDGKIYAVGGDQSGSPTIEEFDPETKQWKIIHTMRGKTVERLASVAIPD